MGRLTGEEYMTRGGVVWSSLALAAMPVQAGGLRVAESFGIIRLKPFEAQV